MRWPPPPWLTRLALIAGAAGALELATVTGALPTISASRPSDVALTLWQLTVDGDLLPNLLRTLGETLAAFLIAAVVGISLGIVLWRLPSVALAVEPYLGSLYAMPLVFFYPLLLALLGLGAAPIIAVAAAMSTVPIALQTRVGLAEVREVHQRVGRVLGCSPARTFRSILLPSAAPYIFAGLKMGYIYAFIGAVGMEVVISDAGIGHMIRYNYEFFATTRMYAYIVVGVALAVVANTLLGRIEARLRGRGMGVASL